MAFRLFGFQIGKPKEQVNQPEEITQKTFAIPQNEDGAVTISSGSYFATYVDLEGVVRNEIELITRYREIAEIAEVDSAITDICNEAIVMDDHASPVDIKMEDLNVDNSIKKKIKAEFDYCLKLLDFGNRGYDIFRTWYIDGRLFYHVVIDETNPLAGIQELRYIDPRRIRKIREIQKTKDPATGIEIIKNEREYYLYNERGVIGTHSNLGAKIAPDSIVNVNSGLMDPKRVMVLSHLHKAIKHANQLRMMEDATVIYRLSRAPERRIFYVDVGNMSTIKAEQYLKDVMNKYRNKLTYNTTTGEMSGNYNQLAMLEDFWLARREGTKGTEISTLPAGQNLGEMEDVKYFERKLYKSLGVPITRMEPQQGFSLGRSQEISRDEVKFTRWVSRLRSKFSTLFDEILRIQLNLKGICTPEEWKVLREGIYYDFLKDNNFDEIKEQELMLARLQVVQMMDPFAGKYFSIAQIRRDVLKQSEEDMEKIDMEMAQEADALMASQQAMGIDPTTGEPYAAQEDQAAQQQQQPQDSSNGGSPSADEQGQARSMGLDYYGFGRYGTQINGNTKVTHVSQGGVLTPVKQAITIEPPKGADNQNKKEDDKEKKKVNEARDIRLQKLMKYRSVI